MTAQEWLVKHDKRPVEMTAGGYNYKFFWQCEDESADPSDDDYYSVLPKALCDYLSGGNLQWLMMAYETKEQALADFEQAYKKWTTSNV